MGQNISRDVDSACPRRRRVQSECCIDFGELEGAALPMSMPQRLSRREVLRGSLNIPPAGPPGIGPDGAPVPSPTEVPAPGYVPREI